MPTIDWGTKVISVPQSELTLLGGTNYQLDVNAFRLALRDLEDSEAGIVFPETHRHSTQVTLSGVTYARQVEIINGYTISFQNTGTPYSIAFVGANHNIADATNYDGGASLIIGNSAGLQVVATGSGVLPSDITAIAAAVMTYILENGESFVETMRLVRAATVGNVESDAGDSLFKSANGGTDRFRSTPVFDGAGNVIGRLVSDVNPA